MRRRWQIVAVIVVALALVWVATVAASDVRRPSRVYQLDSGHFVRTWLDEPIGLLCVALIGHDGVAPARCWRWAWRGWRIWSMGGCGNGGRSDGRGTGGTEGTRRN